MVEKIRKVVARHGLNVVVDEVEVPPDDVVRTRFLGSPTVQVDGVDIEPAARRRTDFAMSCRIYDTPDGLPSEQMIVNALGWTSKDPLRLADVPSASKHGDRGGGLAIGGSLATAILSSACCWVPLLLLVFGASAAGASAFFERWRPIFVAVAVVMLVVSFYLVYIRKRTGACCDDGTCGAKKSASIGTQIMMWISAVAVGAFITFPKWGYVLFDDGQASVLNVQDAGAAQTVSMKIDGMTCEMCAAHLVRELRSVRGVLDASADYAAGSATVVTGVGGPPTNEALATAVRKAGYALIDSTVDEQP